MPKYRANAKVLGLKPGDTFVSDDPYYEEFVDGDKGSISVVDADATQDDHDEDAAGGDGGDDQQHTESGEPGGGPDLGNGQGPDA